MDKAGPDLEGPRCADREGAPPGGEARPGLSESCSGGRWGLRRAQWEPPRPRGRAPQGQEMARTCGLEAHPPEKQLTDARAYQCPSETHTSETDARRRPGRSLDLKTWV